MTVMLSEATEQVMAERRAKTKDRPAYRCEGVCGGTLRPWRRTVAQFPGTTMEYSERRCIGCWYLWKRETEPENPDYALIPCTTEGCGNITRPERAPLATAPGTLRRIGGGACAVCCGPKGSKKSTEHTTAGLDRFLARMRSNAAAVKARGWA
jgi:hypothetical protein